MTEYFRMNYAVDQRDWVRAAAENIPLFEAEAIKAQQRSARAYEYTRTMGSSRFMYQRASDEAAEARMYLFRAIYYRGMAYANRELP